MARFLAVRIIGKHMLYKEVPESLKKQVGEELTKMGRQDLLVE